MTREEFVAQLDRGAAQAGQLPVTGAVLRWTAEQLRKGEPPWWKWIAKAWEKRSFVAWSEAWSLYLTALHFEALSDADCPLVPFFPSCGGTAEADPAPALARFLAAPPPAFLENMKSGHRRTFIQGRSSLWMPAAVLFFQRRNLPYYLVGVNAGAGLDLCPDLYGPAKGFDPELIEARVGLDARPLAVEDIADRRWLTAGIWPDNLEAIAQLDAAIDKVQAACRESATFLQLAACDAAKAPAFIGKNIPHDDPETGLLVFNMGTTARMNDADYGTYAAGMAAALKPWGDRGLWVEVESVRGETYSTTLQLRAFRLMGGQLKGAILASIDLDTLKHQFSPASETFLGPDKPPASSK